MFPVCGIALPPCWAHGDHRVPPRADGGAEPVPGQDGQTLTSVSRTDDESPGLYGFLNVIVHSAAGFKQSSSKWPVWEGRRLGGRRARGCGTREMTPVTIRRL